MSWRKIAVVVGIIVLAIAAFVVRTMWLAGSFRHLEPHFAGTCRLVSGPVGTEDLTIHPRTGIAYLSSSDRRGLDAGQPQPGAIYAYDLNAADARPVNLTPQANASFQPHGISLWVGADGHDALFVINHAFNATGVQHSVEIFDLDAGTLKPRASIHDVRLVMPNDLVAVGPESFYLTNTHKNPPGFMQTIETYLRQRGAQVLFYGDGRFRVAIDDIVMPNGINVSPDGRSLYVASMTGQGLYTYDRDPASETLSLRSFIDLGSGADNIDVDAAGNVWVATHAQLLRLGAHRNDEAQLAPSQILRVSPGAGTVEEVYLNLGEQISAASVAAVRGQRMILGQIFGNGILDCEMR